MPYLSREEQKELILEFLKSHRMSDFSGGKRGFSRMYIARKLGYLAPNSLDNSIAELLSEGKIKVCEITWHNGFIRRFYRLA